MDRPAPAASTAPRVADVDEAALDEIKRYESFSTVDWLVDGARERARAARERAQRTSSEWGQPIAPRDRPPRWWPAQVLGARRLWWAWRFALDTLLLMMDNGVIVLVGAIVGLNMAVISIVSEWLSDLKQGHCTHGWWLNRKFCCWEMHDEGGAQHVVRPVPQVVSIAPLLNATASATASVPASATSAVASATPAALARAAQAVQHVSSAAARYGSLLPRASKDEMAEACPYWVPWSSWSLPMWVVYITASALMACMAAWLVRAFAPYAAGSGISEIKCMIAGFIINGFLGVSTFVLKSLTLPLTIASGLSVGKEGPAVHVACCVGSIVSNLFHRVRNSQAKVRDILCASSAAGVAVAFGSPIGGVLFALEEMTDVFPPTTMWRSFLCALASTVALSFMNPFRTGKLVLFQVSYDRDWHYFEVFFYLIIGLAGGLYGAYVIRYNMQMQFFRRQHLAKHGVAEAVLLAALTAAVAYFNKFLRIDMSESLEILFRECEGGGDYAGLCQTSEQWWMVNSLLLATIVRFVLVVVSYGAKVPAGIFIPSMAIGATFGRMIGILVKALQSAWPTAPFFSVCHPDVPCITPGTYAFLGAAAALAGVTRITVAVVVIMFELTGALTYILPTMIVVMVTKGVADWIEPGGISDQTIRLNGYPFIEDHHELDDRNVLEAMTLHPVCLYSAGETVRSLETKLREGDFRGFPIVAGEGAPTFVGYIGRTELRYALSKAQRDRTIAPDAKVDLTPGAGAHPPAEEEGRTRQHAPEQEGLMSDEEAEVLVARRVDLSAWVDGCRLVVPPTMPLAVVKDMFTKLGPRVILVVERGQLAGLVTIKDLLKFSVVEHRRAEGGEDARGEWEGGVTDVMARGLAWARRLRDEYGVRVRRPRAGYAPAPPGAEEVVFDASDARETEGEAFALSGLGSRDSPVVVADDRA